MSQEKVFVKEEKDSVPNKGEMKRKRSENWSEEDKMLLKELIKERVGCIENKNTDTNTNRSKKKAWLELENDFNKLSTCGKRTVSQLKAQWTVLKVQARKEVSMFRKETKQTGGGPAPQVGPISGNDIAAWLPNEFVVDSNEFDSDILEITQQVCDDNLPSGSISGKKEEDVTLLEVKTEKESEKPKGRNKKKNTRRVKKTLAEEKIEEVAKFDIECRTELHLLQVEAEKKRIRNLDLEYEVLNAKLRFYSPKIVWYVFCYCPK